MDVRSRELVEPFTTADGSTIRVLHDDALGEARNQSLAEATLGAAQARHYHCETEECCCAPPYRHDDTYFEAD